MFLPSFILYLRAISKYNCLGAYIHRGNFKKEFFFAFQVWGVYMWSCLYMEGFIFGILQYFKPIKTQHHTTLNTQMKNSSTQYPHHNLHSVHCYLKSCHSTSQNRDPMHLKLTTTTTTTILYFTFPYYIILEDIV